MARKRLAAAFLGILLSTTLSAEAHSQCAGVLPYLGQTHTISGRIKKVRRYQGKWIVDLIFSVCPGSEGITTNVLVGRCRPGRSARATVYFGEDEDGFPDLTAGRIVCR